MILKFLVSMKLFLRDPLAYFNPERRTLTLKPLEKTLIEELMTAMGNKDREILLSQLTEINEVERVYSPKTIVSLNKIKGLKYCLERVRKFECSSDEYKYARIDFEVDGHKVRAIFYIVFGNFFSIEFTTDVSTMMSESKMEIKNIEVLTDFSD
ncbi:hypothetical protein FJ444_14365 [Aestuariibacter sp. GS-14]|uniref:hypothetical protein n=1 Tax=Aestuariibacter sp. GS-14 TaxID=2590670 RepID=UPI00112B0FF4|nr:hypothetical protein [Aestuariibacter sp. GS-14]TPV56932.1 hypothetical protein FJ444_14365 [Aestuariibacter sp. GS-14]